MQDLQPLPPRWMPPPLKYSLPHWYPCHGSSRITDTSIAGYQATALYLCPQQLHVLLDGSHRLIFTTFLPCLPARYSTLFRKEANDRSLIFRPQLCCMAFISRSSKQSRSYRLTKSLATFHWKSSRWLSICLYKRASATRAFIRERLPFCFLDRHRLSLLTCLSEWKSTSGEAIRSPSEPVRKIFMPKSKPADRPVFGLTLIVSSLSREKHTHQSPIASCLSVTVFNCPFSSLFLWNLKEILCQKAEDISCHLAEMEVMPDHVHVFVKSTPTVAPHFIAAQLKGISSRILRDEFPSLRSRLPTLWTRSYYCESVGCISQETVIRYIERQKKVWRFHHPVKIGTIHAWMS